MAQMNMIEAIRSALDIVMDKDPDVVVLGEDARAEPSEVEGHAAPSADSSSRATVPLVVDDQRTVPPT